MNVFSFCLYGPYNPRYYPGLLENIFLIGKYFPTYKVFVYYGPDVDESMIRSLQACSSVELRETGLIGAINMIHRFYAIDEPSVDVMFVRDADSRVHWKDRWAIRDFINRPQYVAHAIRDNVEHTTVLMGGLWGIRKAVGISIRQEYAMYKEDKSRGYRCGHDQNFLADVIYPKVLPRLLVHFSNNRRLVGEYAIEFPFAWTNDFYCGRVETEFIDYLEPPTHPLNFLYRK